MNYYVKQCIIIKQVVITISKKISILLKITIGNRKRGFAMKKRFLCAFVWAFVVYLLMSFLNSIISSYPDIMAPLALYVAVITFIVSFVSYGIGERSGSKQD